MDVLSEVLETVRLDGAMYYNGEFSAPWCFSSPPSSTLAALLAPAARHLVIYHLLIDGSALVELGNGQSVELDPGDIVILPQGDPHTLQWLGFRVDRRLCLAQ